MYSRARLPHFRTWISNVTAPAGTPGTAVTPGASDAEGSWTEVITGANMTKKGYFISVLVHSGTTSGQQKDHLLDIGVDTAGGSSYTAIISNALCGQSAAYSPTGNGIKYGWYFVVPSGSSVAVRIQGSNATAGTVNVVVNIGCDPDEEEYIPIGLVSETVGTITGSAGVSLTPGNGAKGSWVSLGATTKELFWWQVCFQISDSATTAQSYWVDLAVGNGTDYEIIISNAEFRYISSAENFINLVQLFGFKRVPLGATLYVRAACEGAPDTGCTAVAIGTGGRY